MVDAMDAIRARFFLQRFYVFTDFRTLHLLQSALNLATCQLRDGTLKPSDSVKNGKIFAETNDKPFYDTKFLSDLSLQSSRY